MRRALKGGEPQRRAFLTYRYFPPKPLSFWGRVVRAWAVLRGK